MKSEKPTYYKIFSYISLLTAILALVSTIVVSLYIIFASYTTFLRE